MSRPTDFLRRRICFHREFVEITESITAALFLSQAVYWAESKLWEEFYKTQVEWEQETGMSRTEQESARAKLRDLGLIHERYDRLAHRMYYRVDRDRLDALLEASIPECRNPAVGSAGIPQSFNKAEITSESSAREAESFPAELQTEEFKSAWAEWRKHLREKGKGISDSQRAQLFRTAIPTGAPQAAAIIRENIARGYTRIIWDLKIEKAPPPKTAPAGKRIIPITQHQEMLLRGGIPKEQIEDLKHFTDEQLAARRLPHLKF